MVYVLFFWNWESVLPIFLFCFVDICLFCFLRFPPGHRGPLAMGSPAARSSGNAGTTGSSGGGAVGSTSSYLNSLSTNELMNLAAYVAAKGSSAPPPPPPSTAANSVRSSPPGGNPNPGGNFFGGAAASTSASAANFNMAASLLAQSKSINVGNNQEKKLL